MLHELRRSGTLEPVGLLTTFTPRLQSHRGCVDTERLDPAFAGRCYDETALRDLPPEIDPCGENGELHTFVHGGPVFRGQSKSGRAGWRTAGVSCSSTCC